MYVALSSAGRDLYASMLTFSRCDSFHIMNRGAKLPAGAYETITPQHTMCMFVPTLTYPRCRVDIVVVSALVKEDRVVLPAGARCAQALLCYTEPYQWLDGRMGGQIDRAE
jgi:hypothetical protein